MVAAEGGGGGKQTHMRPSPSTHLVEEGIPKTLQLILGRISTYKLNP